jgi:hypothetical protein
MATIKEMKIIIKKTDKRHTGHPDFKFFITPIEYSPYRNRARQTMFFEIREWAWATWGASKEVEEWAADKIWTSPPNIPKCQNEHWCWVNDNKNYRIYLAGDAELVLFKLRWE